MNESNQLIEQKSNNPRYMKKYLKLSLDIEADILLWEDALKTHKASLANTKNQIRELNTAQNDGKKFIQSKPDKRTGILTGIEIFKSCIKEEEKKERKSSLIKKSIFIGFFAIFFLLLYYFGAGLPIMREVTDYKGSSLWAELLGCAMCTGLVSFMSFMFFAFLPSSFQSCICDYQENIKKLEKELEQLEQQEKDVINNDLYITRTIPQIVKKQSYLTDMISRIEYNLEQSKKIRETVYDEGVLPERYRNIIAVASLYQFLENGICTQIKGHGGIYDTYEYHLKLKEIVDNLIEIRKDLRRIQANQEFLYDKLCDVHETLISINSGINSAAKEIASNTAMTAEAAKRTAVAQEWRNREIWYQ